MRSTSSKDIWNPYSRRALLNKSRRTPDASCSTSLTRGKCTDPIIARFKGYENKDIFKDYAEYSAYKTNKTQYDDRNYASMDNMYRGKRAQKTYEFVDGLPEDYAEKAEIREEIHLANAGKTKDITISDFGKMVQFFHDDVTRINATFT